MRRRNTIPRKGIAKTGIATVRAAAAGMDNPVTRLATTMSMIRAAMMHMATIPIPMALIPMAPAASMTMIRATSTRMPPTTTKLPRMRTRVLP
ncbi:hypothetical protein CHELA41_21937 [Hyphomicrobiales bacterium]|nr:hypothetical protein CHELA41_21937 [Hyphomicrobiales bacterium]